MMTLCVITGHQCQCNPDDGVACPEGSPAAVQAALNAEGRRMEAEIERLREHAVTLAETARQVERARCIEICERHYSVDFIPQDIDKAHRPA